MRNIAPVEKMATSPREDTRLKQLLSVFQASRVHRPLVNEAVLA